MVLETNECLLKVASVSSRLLVCSLWLSEYSTGCALLLCSDGGSDAAAVCREPESTVSIFPFCRKWERDDANGLINYIKK